MNETFSPYIKGKILSAAKALRTVSGDTTVNNEGGRLPPGQRKVERMVAMPPITYDYPVIPKDSWSMRVYGDVRNEKTYSYSMLELVGSEDFTIDFHCVTRWSKLDQKFSGIDFMKILKEVGPLETAKYVIFESYDNYTTNLRLTELVEKQCIIATKMDGKDIDPKFGGPVRAVVPHLYGWKSAKFLSGIKFTSRDEPGFWENLGYNNHGDPWNEERYS